MYVFRDGRRTVTGSELVSSLTGAVGRWRFAQEHEAEDLGLAALIAAGELECALLDDANNSAELCQTASEITEAISFALQTGQRHSLSSILQKAELICWTTKSEVAVQEGFAYYALHPRKVSMLLDDLGLKGPAAVIGIRSIGITLSAVACTSLRLRGLQCRRISVRPTGHPYDRELELTHALREWIERSRDSEFLVLDEGPGISGSSFLATAEALVECGIEAARIHLIGSRAVDPSTLRASNAAERWTRYHFHVLQNAPLLPPVAGENLSGGAWRNRFHCEQDSIPASWSPLEPAKFLASNEQSIFRFEGFGHYGSEIGARARLLASSGFSPRYLGNCAGFGEYEMVPGRMLSAHDWSPALLERIAEYLALRSTAFASNREQTPELEKMLRWDWKLEFGGELDEDESRLIAERVVVCDGRMMPHEWLRTEHGELLKLDAVSHGDNHFFPGPCDIAWDVAGVIAEWNLQGEDRYAFIREYELRSGDPVSKRLKPYVLAYTIFSLGWSKMAALAMQGAYDEALLQRDYERYRALALRVRQSGSAIEVSEPEGQAEDADHALGSIKIA